MKLLSCIVLIMLIVLGLTIFQVHNTSAASNALGNLVASMQPGTWAQLSTNNINQTLSANGASGIIFGYTEYIKWDSVGQRLYYMGSDHNNTGGTIYAEHVQYDAATNTWSRLPHQSWAAQSPGSAIHGYDHGAIDPVHRYFYFRPFADRVIHRYHMDTGVWTSMPANNVTPNNSDAVGIEYFPELHGVIWAGDESGDNGGLTRLNDATGQWDRIGQAAAYSIGQYHNFAEYNPVRKVVVFGGGTGGSATRQMWKVDANGVVTRLNPAPVAIGIQSSIFTVDPVSGDYLVFTSSNQFYVYNVVTDTWTLKASGSAVPIWTTSYADPVHGVVGGPIDTYGVNVFVTCDGSNNCKVNLYKHSSGGGTPPPPSSFDYSLSNSGNQTVTQGSSVTNLITGTLVSGTTQSVSFSASGLPAGATASFSSASCSPTCSSTMTISSASSTPVGTYSITVTGTGGVTHTTTFSLNVNAPSSFDFSLSSGGNKSVTQGSSVTNAINTTLISGATQSVSFSATGLPAGATASYSSPSCPPACGTTMTISTASSTPTGTYNVTVTGTGGVSHTTNFNLTVNTATSTGSLSFTEKCAQTGVVRCIDFDDVNELFYGWPGKNDFTSSSVCDNDPFLKTKQWNSISLDRSGPGNVYAIIQNNQCQYPIIDNSITHSGAGSLKFTIPSNSSANSSGYFTEVFQRLSNGKFGYIGPGSSLGSVLYLQFYQRFDPNFLSTVYRCSGGDCSGWKQIINFGNPPNGASSSSLEVTMINGWQRGVPSMYGQQGTDDYGIQDIRGCTYGTPGYSEPPCIRYKANQWMEFTERIEIRGTSNAPQSRVQLWIDGQLAIDYGKAMVAWGAGGDGDGFGAMMFTPYHTNKDASQATPTGYTWYDDLVISTQPIAMANGSTPPPSSDTTPPTVSISAPASGSTVSGTSVTVSATAADNVGVAGVQFKLDGANLGAEDTAGPPYSISWNTTTVANGTHTLTAIARDAAGNQTTSAAVSVTVNNGASDTTPPTVSITAPATGSTVSATVTLSATASDNVGVVGVQFKLDGANLGAEDTAGPYSISWNTTTVANGTHTLTVIARDAAGNQTTSAAVSVTVNNGASDTTPPTVSITAPATGSTVSAAVTLSATASDNVGVAGVQFKLDGANLGAEDTAGPYSISWNTATVPNGTHTLTAVARDAAGNQTTSAAVSVTVNNVVPDTTPPTVSITGPAGGSTVSATIAVSAIASDDVGVVGVQFKVDGANLGAEITVEPSSTSWNTTTVSDGTHILTAVARDAAGNQTTSAPVSVTVGNSTAPTVSIMSPTINSTVSSTVPVSATASDGVGIAGVQFQVDGANWGPEVRTPPYRMSWNTLKVSNGSHILKALARDNSGIRKISSGVTVKVYNPIKKRLLSQLTSTFTIFGSGGQSFFTGTASPLTDGGSAATATSDPLQIGYAGIQMDSTPSSPSGFAILTGRTGGVLVSETSVPAAATMSSGRIYANINGPINTGIALANQNSEDAVISFYFTDGSGNDFGQGSFTLGANQQTARFLNQDPFNGTSMEGTFTFNSSVPVGVAAIQGVVNQRSEFLISLLPVASLGDLNNNPVLLPQFTDGAGWTTQLVLTNPSDDPINGAVQFFGPGSITQDGAPLSLWVNGILNSTFSYGIAPRSAVRLVTGNVGSILRMGSIRVTPSSGSAPVAVEMYSFFKNGITVSQASILAASTASAFRMYAETSGPVTQPLSIQSGVAIANPGQAPVTVNIALTQMDGTTVGQPTTVTIPANGQTAKYVKELFPSSPDNFSGFITVTASSPIGVVGLRMRANERGDYLLTPTPPRNDSDTLMDSEIVFPVISSGAGYSVQFVIFGQSGSGGIYYNSADGTPMAAGSLRPQQ